MKICITRSEKYAYSETFIRNIISGLSKYADIDTIHTGRLPERKEDNTLIYSRFLWVMHKFSKIFIGRNNFFSTYGLKKHLQKNNIDCVFSNYGMSASHMVPVCKKLNIPLIAIFHGHDATDIKILKNYKKKYQRLFDYATYIVVVSNEMKKRLMSIGAPEEKIQLIPYGIDTTQFKPVSEVITDRKFLAVGRFTSKKGPLYTIRAFSKVVKEYPDATLTMVGKKSGLYEKCSELVSSLNISKSVTFTGILDQKQISDLMQSSTAYVQHSIIAPNGDMEGTPLSILEAAASGLPIVSTLHGGIKEAVIHGETGYLVEEKDENKMADYLILLCKDPEKAKTMGLNGRDHALDNYNRVKQIKKLYTLVEKAVQNN
ncbi:glycosyltransferase family 4 protein [Carboxylicivirga linearis]|uniref:Glycosyltransferase family 4 protein n=1 Tax=Carboxylicivirga linearis TaxID=1628157 RepID=A0ABS5JP93_9BACT|nr:glycosyltransferase family 4 protein [Carboxylicivirga linearis]MBS2096705.1 glycosyltransferase family 4 protein [Carboxylicivirga linearis]